MLTFRRLWWGLTETETMSKITEGTIIHGTLRNQDLIPAFLDVLREVNPAAYQQVVYSGGFSGIPAYAQDDEDSDWWASEDAGWLCAELIDAINDAAPDGLYFGAHEGDGSDFGFWSYEPEES